MNDKLTPEEIRQVKISRSLKDLVATPAWKDYVKFLSDITREYHTKVLAPSSGIDGVLASEYAKGAVYGLTQAVSLPDHIIKVTNETILSKDSAPKESN